MKIFFSYINILLTNCIISVQTKKEKASNIIAGFFIYFTLVPLRGGVRNSLCSWPRRIVGVR